ncbi:MAG: hypothetical protein K9M84_07065 [Spirochaetia bacterium]|nr:hypothetical protein [Spirochaetia bacterium]
MKFEGAVRSIRWYALSVIGISVAAVLSVLAVHHFWGADPVPSDPGRVLSMICLMAAVTFSVALPVLLRSLFYARGMRSGGLPVKDFIRMQKLSILSVCIGSLCAVYAYYRVIYVVHLYMSVLSALYGIYTILPVRTSYERDLKSFGVHDDELSS